MGRTCNSFDDKELLLPGSDGGDGGNHFLNKSTTTADDGSTSSSSKPLTWGIIRVPFRDVARITVSLPLCGFVFCVIWALYLDKEAATYTHCGVRNYLPSVSAAMSKFTLSRAIWRICIALHATPRFAITGMYYRYLRSVTFRKYTIRTQLTCLCNIMENLGLIGLTYVSSTENYSVHEKCFVIFMISSTLYMLLLCQLLNSHRNIPSTFLESKSLRVKWILVIINLSCFALACYVFIRHNLYCEEGMYTIFALLEYLVILSNMGFHMTAYWDFYDRVLTIGPYCLKTD